MDDVRAAVAVDQSGSDRLPRDIHEIEITSDTEIHIYGTRRNNHLEIYREVKLVRGQWRRGDRVIVTH